MENELKHKPMSMMSPVQTNNPWKQSSKKNTAETAVNLRTVVSEPCSAAI